MPDDRTSGRRTVSSLREFSPNERSDYRVALYRWYDRTGESGPRIEHILPYFLRNTLYRSAVRDYRANDSQRNSGRETRCILKQDLPFLLLRRHSRYRVTRFRFGYKREG